ncbi:unnamed protein product [Didymodactylos carnosus]|uniref:Nitric oxide synthase-interacting protein zinc-finger domain-containing protein n=1 Tax=Didymodactylos carnosus TaxID=1234261 RepID=A0A8S2DG71_9BILA|nr:unnamed protein product [Didymodactylos carnosus]CAF3670861.1 unnamed protein product [Didymodactylos carnosus]
MYIEIEDTGLEDKINWPPSVNITIPETIRCRTVPNSSDEGDNLYEAVYWRLTTHRLASKLVSAIVKCPKNERLIHWLHEYICDKFDRTLIPVYADLFQILYSEVQQLYPSHSIIFIGWNVAAVLSLKAALNCAISTVICLSLPFMSISEQTKNDLLTIKSSILFVNGQYSKCESLEQYRTHLQVRNGFVLVNECNEKLLMSENGKYRLRLTQQVIDKLIMEEILHFIMISSKFPNSASHCVSQDRNNNNHPNREQEVNTQSVRFTESDLFDARKDSDRETRNDSGSFAFEEENDDFFLYVGDSKDKLNNSNITLAIAPDQDPNSLFLNSSTIPPYFPSTNSTKLLQTTTAAASRKRKYNLINLLDADDEQQRHEDAEVIETESTKMISSETMLKRSRGRPPLNKSTLNGTTSTFHKPITTNDTDDGDWNPVVEKRLTKSKRKLTPLTTTSQLNQTQPLPIAQQPVVAKAKRVSKPKKSPRKSDASSELINLIHSMQQQKSVSNNGTKVPLDILSSSTYKHTNNSTIPASPTKKQGRVFTNNALSPTTGRILKMTRHSKNATANTVYTYHEKKKDSSFSGYGTLQLRLSKDAIKEFDCCNLTLQPCRDPVITQDGYLYDKEAILEYIVHQKTLNARKLKEYQKQLDKQQQDIDEQNADLYQIKLNKFLERESTYSVNQSIKALMEQKVSSSTSTPSSVMSAPTSSSRSSTSSKTLSNMEGNQARQLPSYWVPSLTPAAKTEQLKKPDNKVYCPMSGKPIAMKDLIPVKLKLANDVDPSKKSLVAYRDRYVCAVTGDVLGNSVPCAVLRTSGSVVTMDCINKLIKKDMLDPINGSRLTERDIILLQGGTGYSASGAQLDAKLPGPAMQ